jgi:hypothetical protein
MTIPLSEEAMLAALRVIGIDPQKLSLSSNDDERNLTSFVAYSDFSVITDWRDPVIDTLGQFESHLLRHKVRMQVGDDAVVVVSLSADQFAVRFQLPDLDSNNRNLHELVFALDSLLPPFLAIYSLVECDDSDGLAYALLPVETWDKLKLVLGPNFNYFFAKHPALKVKKLAVPKSTPRARLKKINWQKEYDHHRRTEPTVDEPPISVDRYLTVVEAIDPRCPTPIIRHARTPTCPYNQCIQEAFQKTLDNPARGGSMATIVTPSEMLGRFARDLNSTHSDPWLVHGQTDRLATLLYEHAYANLIATSFAFVCGHYRPTVSCSFAPLGTGDPTWSYFVFLALGCEDEATRLGDLLMHPAAQTAERAPWEKNREAYCDLAVYLHQAEAGLNLAVIDPVMVLSEPTAWDDPENIIQALQYHCVKRGESFTHPSRRWMWPAPIYALARRCQARDKLPPDNPFLNQWRDRSDIDWTSVFIGRLQEIDKKLSRFVESGYPQLMPVAPTLVSARVEAIENGKIFGITDPQSIGGQEFAVKGSLDLGQPPNVGELWNFKMTSTGSVYIAETHPDLGNIHYEKYRLEGIWTNQLPGER